MRTLALGLAAGLLIAGAAPTQAQQVSQGYWVTPKQGQADQLRTALANHSQWRSDHGDPWGWTIFEVVQGSNIGDWYITSFGHAWGDLDTYEAPEGASEHWQATVAPHVAAFRSNLLVTDDVLTRAPEAGGGYMLYHITTFNLEPATIGTFNQAVARMMEAYDEAGVPYYRFYWNMAIGPDDQQKVRSRPYRSWAEMAQAPNTAALMIDAFGEDEAAETFEAYSDAVVSTRDYVLLVHPEMSVPSPM